LYFVDGFSVYDGRFEAIDICLGFILIISNVDIFRLVLGLNFGLILSRLLNKFVDKVLDVFGTFGLQLSLLLYPFNHLFNN